MPAAAPTLLAATALAPADWMVVALYFGILVITGILLSRRQSGTEDYYLAGRRMPAWAVAISVLATSLSAATFIGGPQQAYAGNLTYLITTLGTVIGALVVAFCFLPAFYRHNVTTVYDLLAHRFGPGEPEGAFGGRVEVDHQAAVVHRDHMVLL